MGFKTTSFNSRRARARGGFTITELLFGIGIGGIVVAAIAALVLYSGKSFASLANYTDMDSAALNAIDQLSRDIRQANGLQAYATNSITLSTDTGTNLTYSFSTTTRTLTRTQGSSSKVVLRECDSLKFSTYQRTPIEGTFNQYLPGATNETKVIFVTWNCSRTVFGKNVNTDSASTARIVMRVN